MYVFGILPRPVCSLLQDGFTWPGTIVPGLFSALFQGQFSVDAFLLFCHNVFTASRQRRLMMRPVESLLGPVHAGRRTIEDTKSVNIQKKKSRGPYLAYASPDHSDGSPVHRTGPEYCHQPGAYT